VAIGISPASLESSLGVAGSLLLAETNLHILYEAKCISMTGGGSGHLPSSASVDNMHSAAIPLLTESRADQGEK